MLIKKLLQIMFYNNMFTIVSCLNRNMYSLGKWYILSTVILKKIYLIPVVNMFK